MKYRAVALDLDQTTLDDRARLSNGNREALTALMARGVEVIIASGRSFRSLPDDMLSLPGIRYAITCNGASVYALPEGRQLWGRLLTPESIHRVLDEIKGLPVAVEAFVDGQGYVDADYWDDCGPYCDSIAAQTYIQATRIPVPSGLAYLLKHIRKIESIDLVMKDPELKKRLWEVLAESRDDLYITTSAPPLLELSHAEAGKHNALAWVLGEIGILPEETIAFGDGDNDAGMLRFAGLGVAMENGTKNAKRSADRIAPDHAADGVARILRSLRMV